MFVEPNDAKCKSILSNGVTTLNLFRIYYESEVLFSIFLKRHRLKISK